MNFTKSLLGLLAILLTQSQNLIQSMGNVNLLLRDKGNKRKYRHSSFIPTFKRNSHERRSKLYNVEDIITNSPNLNKAFKPFEMDSIIPTTQSISSKYRTKRDGGIFENEFRIIKDGEKKRKFVEEVIETKRKNMKKVLDFMLKGFKGEFPNNFTNNQKYWSRKSEIFDKNSEEPRTIVASLGVSMIEILTITSVVIGVSGLAITALFFGLKFLTDITVLLLTKA